MHQRPRTRLFGITAVALTGLALSACSGGTASTGPDLSQPAPTGVTLTMWHNTADSEALLALYDAYEEYSGNVIELVDIPQDTFPMTVQSKWATGERPDILEWHGNRMDLQSLNAAENLVDLSSLDFVEKLGDLGDLSGSLDGVTYGTTLGPLSYFGIFYNKQVLDAAGLDVPESYADLAEACTVLQASAPGVTPIAEAGGSGFPPAILSSFDYMGEYNIDAEYANGVAAGDIKVNDPDGPFVAGLEAYADLRDDGCFNADAATATFEASLNGILAGTVAFTALPSDMIGLLNVFSEFDTAKVDATVGFAPLSATEAVVNFSPNPSGTYYVPFTGDHEKERAAVDFIEFVSGEGYQDYVDAAGIIPTLSGATVPQLQGITQQVYEVSDGAALTVNSAIPGFGNFGTEATKLLAGQSTPQEVADQMQAYVDQALAALGG